MRWRIYLREREYARVHGDPCLGEVDAPDKETAEQIAAEQRLNGNHLMGVWACRVRTVADAMLDDDAEDW